MVDGVRLLSQLASVSNEVGGRHSGYSLSMMSTRCEDVFPSLYFFFFSTKVTLASARKVTLHVQSVSEKLWKPGAPTWSSLDENTLDTLVDLLSRSLQAIVGCDDFTEDSPPPDGRPTSGGRRPDSRRRETQLVAHTVETASDLILVGRRGNVWFLNKLPVG